MTDAELAEAALRATIDWSKHGSVVSQTLQCLCGVFWRSHAKAVNTLSGFVLFSKDPCPACGSHKPIAARGDPESWSVRK